MLIFTGCFYNCVIDTSLVYGHKHNNDLSKLEMLVCRRPVITLALVSTEHRKTEQQEPSLLLLEHGWWSGAFIHSLNNIK